VAYGSREWKTLRKQQILEEQAAAAAAGAASVGLNDQPRASSSGQLDGGAAGDHGLGGEEGEVVVKGGGIAGRAAASIGGKISKLNLSFKTSKRKMF